MAEQRVALLRGINVGRANRVAMADLRLLVADLGNMGVRTLLNSGNVVFTATDEPEAQSAARIEFALADRLGVRARVTVMGASALARIAEQNPLLPVAPDASRLLVTFPSPPAHVSRLRTIAEQDWTPEAIALGEGVAYLWCPDGVSNSRLWLAAGGVLGDAVTSRNWATVCKLLALTEGEPAPG